VKEYLLLVILDFLSTTRYIRKITFIGGTNLRLVKGIDRFSEDLDFDCKNFSRDEFTEMTDAVIRFLTRSGLEVEVRDNENPRLKAFRRNLYFPQLTYKLGLTGHKEERFLIKIECQDQGISYPSKLTNISGCGFYFPCPVPGDEILCSMKLSAMLDRQKGRDFYDVMFLLALTQPDYGYLFEKHNIRDLAELKSAVEERLKTVDLTHKKRDFEHLLFNRKNSERILLVSEFFKAL
jgi:predicted nucleotidyltransferase component of viral defense system